MVPRMIEQPFEVEVTLMMIEQSGRVGKWSPG